MIRPAMFLAVLGLAALHGPAAVADGGGFRDALPDLRFEYSDKEEATDEPETDTTFYGWFGKGSRGEFEFLRVRFSDSEYFQTDFSTARALDYGASSGSGSGEMEFGTAFRHEGNLYFSPKIGGFIAGLNFDRTRPIEFVEETEDRIDWGLEIPAGYGNRNLRPEMRLRFQAAADEGEPLGKVYYGDNRFRLRVGVSYAITDDAPEVEVKAEPEPEISIGPTTGFRGLFHLGYQGEFGHLAVRLSKYHDIRVEFSAAYALIDDEGSRPVASNNPLKAIAGLFSNNSDEPEAQRFGTAYIHMKNLYVMPDSLSGFNFRIDPARDIEVVEKYQDYEDYEDWGVRLRVGYNFNELTDDQVGAYREAAEMGRKFGDVYYDDNRFTIFGDPDFIYKF